MTASAPWLEAVNTNLDAAAEVMNRHHGQDLPTDVALAVLAQVQATATIALAQAVMYLAETIKETQTA